jgi:hypothetical protein
MLKKLQALFKEQALVANSGVQCLDYGFVLDENFAFSRYFLERFEEGPNGRFHVLRPIERNKKTPESPERQIAEFVDAETGEEVTSAATYSVPLKAALDVFDGSWLPAPFFKRKGQDYMRRQTFEPGPSNWARLRVVKLESPDDKGYTHRLTLAFDTQPEEMIRGGTYVCPTPEDVRNETRFEFAPALRDNSWLLEQDWVKDWLNATLDQAVRQRAARIPKRQDGGLAECANWSFYVVLVQGLEALIKDATSGNTSNAALPVVRFLNTFSATAVTPTDVDLVLDIGNSRTCGVLIERGFGGGLNIKDASVLELRDISRPHLAYQEPFRSHVEFVQPWFGNPYWSRAGGREAAFNWPSLVRVGPEALRLNVKSGGSSGDTGLSSPKRYLWDERENRQPWYFNSAESGGSDPVMGVLMELLTQDGNVLKLAGADARPALQPKFSRASLFSFMVMELLLQAIVQINSPGYRAARQHPDVPRRLHRVVFTIPTATPMVERACYQKRCVAAIKLLWQALGWGQQGIGTSGEPEINIAYDEATCTQVVYLYNEIVEKFRKAPREFFKLVGSGHASRAGSELRVASLDIGGGTTDLMIVTYQVEPTGDALNPQQNFREGFRRAGDDILEAIISEHVLKPLTQALQRAGMPHSQQFLTGFMADSGKDAFALQMRKLFVTRVLAPIALALLSQYETVGMFAEKRDPITFAEIAGSEAGSLHHIVGFFQEAAREEGAKNFSLAEVAFDFDFAGLGATTAGVMGPILSLMCEVIHRFDCDVLLMSGRPSRLPIIRDLMLRFLPTPPHRIVFMHEYRVGNWYKFTGRHGTIEDPKTTVVMGALLCALAAERKVTDFALNSNRFGTTVSTANYIGRIFGDDMISNQDVIFAREKGRFPTESRPLAVDGPMFIGFRQLPVERWPGTPLFFLDIADTRPWGVGYGESMPWLVTFRREEPGDNVGNQPASGANETFWVDQIVDRNREDVARGRVQIRLQTLRNLDGYWLDTGIVALN